MTKLFAVYYTPSEGPDAIFLIKASSRSEAREMVLGKMHEADMDGVVLDDITDAIELGNPDEFFVVGVHIDAIL